MNKLFISNEAISIAVRDFFKLITILGLKLVLTNIIFILFVKCMIRPFQTCCMKCFTKSFLYYQQGSTSLTISKKKTFQGWDHIVFILICCMEKMAIHLLNCLCLGKIVISFFFSFFLFFFFFCFVSFSF